MDFTEEAARAVDALARDVGGGTLDGDAVIIARLAWLDGYAAGAKATKEKADAAFAALQAELS